jgi:hypothetical protein
MPRRLLVKLLARLDLSSPTQSATRSAGTSVPRDVDVEKRFEDVAAHERVAHRDPHDAAAVALGHPRIDDAVERGNVPDDNICRRITRVFRAFLERRSDCDYGVVMAPASQPKSERLKQAVMAALQAAGGAMQIVNLNKALFYVDLVALRDFGTTITGQEYLALENGPVVMNYDRRIVETLVNAGCAVQEQDPSGYGKPLRVTAPMDVFTALSDNELKVVRSVAKYVVKQTAKSLSDLSHNNPGWQLAYRGKGAKAEAINMRIALQQLDDNDADDNGWLRAPLNDDEQTAVAAAAIEDGVPWGRSAGAGR